MNSSPAKKGKNALSIARYIVVVLLMLAVAGWVTYKVIDNSVIHADDWNKAAHAELSKVKVIPPERGNILSANGTILATNLTYYNIRLDYRSEKFLDDTLRRYIGPLSDSLALHFPLRDAEGWKKRLLAPLDKEKKDRPRAYPVLLHLTYEQTRLLRTFPFFNIKNPNRNGLVQNPEQRRVLPYGTMARRSIGRVGIDTINAETHGITGLERALDSLLYGTPGIAKKIPLTNNIVNWTDVPPVSGYDITTTIDINLQDIVENELQAILTECDAEWGVAVLMEVSTGNIRAISNLEKRKGGAIGDYIEGENRAVQGFEPGSVVKTLSMMVALEDGIVSNPEQVIQTGYSFAYAGGRAITDSHGAPSMRVREVIERSSNIGMAKIITSRYGANPGAFYSRLKSLGFLDPMHIGIAGERIPRIDSLANNRGGRITLSRMAFGYATEIPPLYTLSVYNAIANDGVYVRPRLVQRMTNAYTDTILPISYMGNGRACSPENARKMRRMLTDVVWGDHGTARSLRDPKVRVAGKTGTCYMTARGGGYDHGRKRLAFCGFFPADNPKYSCIVLTCHPRRAPLGAAGNSGHVLKNIALKMYSRGMLDNESDYRSDAPANPEAPTLLATTRQHAESIRRTLGAPRVRHYNHNIDRQRHNGIPSVIGCPLRDAIDILESDGFDVTFDGSGYVTAQSLRQGDDINPGHHIHLTLR